MLVYCRHEGAVLLVQQRGAWLPLGDELKDNETPLEAAERVVWEVAGIEHPVFPHIHSVLGAPVGLLLYEEHPLGTSLHMNFAFIAEVPHKVFRSDGKHRGAVWVASMADLPEGTPPFVQDALPYALTAGVT